MPINVILFIIILACSNTIYVLRFAIVFAEYLRTQKSEKMGKKSKKSIATPIAKEPEPSKKGLISDTTCLVLGNTSWESIYNLIEAEEPEKLSKEATADSTNKLEGTLKELACSYLHRIATRAKILPYTDVVRWVVEKILMSDKTFSTVDGRIFRSFKPEDLRQMYHLPPPKK